MALSRKHFEAVARILESNNAPVEDSTPGFIEGWEAGREAMRRDVANDLADYFATENPNFDRQRFLKACGL